MATTVQPTPEVKVNVGVAKKRVFNLDSFEKETKEVQYEVPAPFTKVDEILGMDETKLLAIVNEGNKRQAWKEARAKISGISPKLINQTVNTFRMYMFQDLVEKDSKGEVTPESRKKQTTAIYAFIRGNEQILNSLKDAALRAAASEDEEDDNEE